MRQVVLDGGAIADRRMLHQVLARCLPLPDRYGGNLDALADSLSEMVEDLEICVVNRAVLEEKLGRYAQGLYEVLRRSAAENPHIHVSFAL